MNTLQLTLTKRYRYKSTDFFSSLILLLCTYEIKARDSSEKKRVKNTVSMYAVQSNKNISVCIRCFDHIQNILCLGGVLNLLEDFVMIINYCWKISVIFFFCLLSSSLQNFYLLLIELAKAMNCVGDLCCFFFASFLLFNYNSGIISFMSIFSS